MEEEFPALQSKLTDTEAELTEGIDLYDDINDTNASSQGPSAMCVRREGINSRENKKNSVVCKYQGQKMDCSTNISEDMK